MSTGIRTFLVRTSPEKIITANTGDYFYRSGSLFFLISPANNEQKRLDHEVSNFLTEYKNPFYYRADVRLETSEELWRKESGTETSRGWKIVASGSSVGFSIKTVEVE